MLFNSLLFVFAFLPVSLLGFFAAARFGRRPAALWLVVVSFVFYGWWNPAFVPLLIVSIAVNYGLGHLIAAHEKGPGLQTALVMLAVILNLGALAYYKYLFVLLAWLHGAGWMETALALPALPLGISFFTFTQLGYLMDVRQGATRDQGLLNYLVFVTFFPHLIAGPILHNREMMPQFADSRIYRFNSTSLSVGLSIFTIGLLKKCLLADPIAAAIGRGFDAPDMLSTFASWDVALSYSMQLYFDFSGYSDMAVGLARMFNVRFPVNFNSPYKSASIIEYWQRWHMTLTRYLTLYLYNPISLSIARRRIGAGKGASRAAYATIGGFSAMVLFPTFVTMGLAGVWHGAGLQFLIFGLLHATYLTVNHAWRIVRRKTPTRQTPWYTHAANVLLTYLCVLVGAVFFRSSSTSAALQMLSGMIGLHGAGRPGAYGDALDVHLGLEGRLWLLCLFAIAWFTPNCQQIMRNFEPILEKVTPGPITVIAWRPSLAWAGLLGAAAAVAIMAMGGSTEFLYFQF